MKSKGLKGAFLIIGILCTFSICISVYAKTATNDYAGYYSITYSLDLSTHSGTASTNGATGADRNYASIVVYDKNNNSLGTHSSTAKASGSTNGSSPKATIKVSTGTKTVKKGKSCHAVCDNNGSQLASFTEQLTLTTTR